MGGSAGVWLIDLKILLCILHSRPGYSGSFLEKSYPFGYAASVKGWDVLR
jgi:hypothetical protein